jgi:hypothetical protein
MAASTKAILCGSCKVPIEGPANPKPNDVLACPSCGRSDKFNNVQTEVAKFFHEHTARMVQDTMRKATRGNKFLKYKPGFIPKRSYRFILDL